MSFIAQVLLLAAIAAVVVPVLLRSRALSTRPDHGADNSSGADY